MLVSLRIACPLSLRVSTPEKITAYLDARSVSDVRHTGRDHEPEFNETLATLLQVVVRRKPENYDVDPARRDAPLDRVLHRYRHPETGFWGERYRRNGGEEFPDDLSMTFHVVSYLKGKVPDVPRLLETTLAIQDFNYPAGWLWKVILEPQQHGCSRLISRWMGAGECSATKGNGRGDRAHAELVSTRVTAAGRFV